jgi:hypothetical protein
VRLELELIPLLRRTINQSATIALGTRENQSDIWRFQAFRIVSMEFTPQQEIPRKQDGSAPGKFGGRGGTRTCGNVELAVVAIR